MLLFSWYQWKHSSSQCDGVLQTSRVMVYLKIVSAGFSYWICPVLSSSLALTFPLSHLPSLSPYLSLTLPLSPYLSHLTSLSSLISLPPSFSLSPSSLLPSLFLSFPPLSSSPLSPSPYLPLLLSFSSLPLSPLPLLSPSISPPLSLYPFFLSPTPPSLVIVVVDSMWR